MAVELEVDAVFFNHDDDPAALARDAAVEAALRARGIAVHHTKDAVIFERKEVRDYPAPIVDHATQRARALGVFKLAALLP